MVVGYHHFRKQPCSKPLVYPLIFQPLTARRSPFPPKKSFCSPNSLQTSQTRFPMKFTLDHAKALRGQKDWKLSCLKRNVRLTWIYKVKCNMYIYMYIWKNTDTFIYSMCICILCIRILCIYIYIILNHDWCCTASQKQEATNARGVHFWKSFRSICQLAFHAPMQTD